MRISSVSATPAEIWAAVTRGLTGDVGITQVAADKVWGTVARSLTQESILETVASDTLRSSADTEKSTASTSYVKLKQMRVCFNGIYRIAFALKTANAIYYAIGKIYKNGLAIGIERLTHSTNYVSFSEDLSFRAGDTIEIWGHTDSAAYIAYVNNFRVYCDYQTVITPTLHPYVEINV